MSTNNLKAIKELFNIQIIRRYMADKDFDGLFYELQKNQKLKNIIHNHIDLFDPYENQPYYFNLCSFIMEELKFLLLDQCSVIYTHMFSRDSHLHKLVIPDCIQKVYHINDMSLVEEIVIEGQPEFPDTDKYFVFFNFPKLKTIEFKQQPNIPTSEFMEKYILEQLVYDCPLLKIENIIVP